MGFSSPVYLCAKGRRSVVDCEFNIRFYRGKIPTIRSRFDFSFRFHGGIIEDIKLNKRQAS
jgi:hypothetical protein